MRTSVRRKCLVTRIAWAVVGPAVGVPLIGLALSVARVAEGVEPGARLVAAATVGVLTTLGILVLVVSYEHATGD